MAEQTLVKVKLPRTGRYIFLNESDTKDFEEEGRKRDEEDAKKEADGAEKDKSVESKMAEHESLKKEFEAMKKELEESKGKLSVIKKKLDELLSDEAIEKKAGEMNEEQGDADEIIENCEKLKNETGEEMPELDEKKKEEFKNSYRKLHGPKLYSFILNAIGIKVENMSPDAQRGAFNAARSLVGKGTSKKTVSGHNMFQNESSNANGTPAQIRAAALHRLGYREEASK